MAAEVNRYFSHDKKWKAAEVMEASGSWSECERHLFTRKIGGPEKAAA
jgi:hypothetical protein